MSELRAAAEAVIRATDAYRDAVNGLGHDHPHDRVLAPAGHDVGGGMVIHDLVGDCAACGGAQYGAEDVLNGAIGDLRAALGYERKPWEYHRGAPAPTPVPTSSREAAV